MLEMLNFSSNCKRKMMKSKDNLEENSDISIMFELYLGVLNTLDNNLSNIILFSTIQVIDY